MSNEHNKAPAVPQGFTAEENPVMALSDCINVLESPQLLNDSVRVWACVQNAKAAMKSLASPSQPAVPMSESQRADMACAVAAICTGSSSRAVAATAIEWAERFYGIATPAAPSQEPLTDDADDPVLSALMGVPVSKKVWGEFREWQLNKEAALREKEKA